ncbi:DUF6049 family protein [Kineococcus sp. SYSU DK004]|uniref:DUF6049 family protein n=1 Tax=Kineococcus sp. SYSU DK004 TaxID=3383125 RepID=UPI003D7CA593
MSAAPGPGQRALPRRAVLAAGLAAGAAAAAAGTGTAAAATTPSPTRSGGSGAASAALPVEVTLLEVTPAAYDAQDPARAVVTARARVRSTATAPLEGLRARLVVQRGAMITRPALASWADAPPTRSLGAVAASEPVDVGAGAVLAPGEEADVLLSLPAEQLGTARGAHAAAVEVLAGSQRVGLARTFVTAAVTAEPTRLAVLVPLVAGRTADLVPPAAEGDAAGRGLPALVAEGGRLRRVLDATPDRDLTWALDPSLLTAATVLTTPAPGAPDAAVPPDAPPAEEPDGVVAAWLEDLREAAGGRDVLALPHGDPDVASLARSGDGARLLAEAAAAGAVTGLDGATVLTGVAWPADEAADAATLDLVAAGGASAVVLSDASSPLSADTVTFTPTGRTDYATSTGAVLEGLLADEALSDALAAAGTGDATGTQRLLAELATITLQRPNDPRTLLAAVPRSWDPEPAAVDALLGAVRGSGWAQLEPLSGLLAEPAADGARAAPRLTDEAERGRLPLSHLAAVADRLERVDDFASALVEPSAALTARRLATLALLGVSWRGHPEELAAARARGDALLDDMTSAVHVLAGSVRNLVATRSELPVTVVNDLDVPVAVDVVLRPRTPRVQLGSVARQTVAPRTQLRVAVPVRALANGTVVVDAQLRTPAGAAIGAPEPVTLNVRMGVEGWVTGAVGGVAGVLLATGVVRAVRRGRRRVDDVQHADLDRGERADLDRDDGTGRVDGTGGARTPSAPPGQG